MIVYQPLRTINPAAIASQSGATRPYSLYYPRIRIPSLYRPGLRGLGQVSLPGLSEAGAQDHADPNSVYGAANSPEAQSGLEVNVPGIGPIDSQTVHEVRGIVAAVESWLGIGSGRREADVIVPQQNALAASWGPCVNQILVGAPCNITNFNRCYMQVWQGAVAFMQFVQRRDIFSDGRASEQALNGIMPYIDGSCGYKWPPPMHPTQFNCLGWGGGTLGGNGTTGILGAIERAIRVCGGSGPPQVQPGPGGVFPHPSPVPPGTGGTLLGGLSGNSLLIIGGIIVLAMYGRRTRG